MRTIRKSRPPDDLSAYLKKTPGASFEDLKSNFPDLRSSLANEQYGLCAYCCIKLSETPTDGRTRIAHVVPRAVSPHQANDYRNMVLSCDTQSEMEPSCDSAQGDRALPVSPLMPEVQALFRFELSGKMQGLNDSASETIGILGLACERLNSARKAAILAALETRNVISQAKWKAMMTGNFEPLPSFQPAIADVIGRLSGEA